MSSEEKTKKIDQFISAVSGFVQALSGIQEDINDYEEENEIDFPFVEPKKIAAVATALKFSEKPNVIGEFVAKKHLWGKVKERNLDFFLDNFKEVFSSITVDLSPIITPIRVYVDLQGGKKYKNKIDKDDWPVTEVDIQTLWTWVDKMILRATEYSEMCK